LADGGRDSGAEVSEGAREVKSPFTTDFTTVTEAPGDALRHEALEMLWTRYAFAAEYCRGRHVLEVACGAGQGLGLLAKTAARVVGGDYTERLLGLAKRHYGSRVPLVRLDGQQLPFRSGSFDVVLLYEAVYYLPEPALFLEECRRVLRPGGRVLLCTANKSVADFNPSPFHRSYYSGPELIDLFRQHRFDPVLLGAFPAGQETLRDRLISVIKRIAVALHLVPKTMRGKALLKRLFFGPLEVVPAELTDGAWRYQPPQVVPSGTRTQPFRVLFVNATVA
jgi:SAM-dependent methyltransferase